MMKWYTSTDTRKHTTQVVVSIARSRDVESRFGCLVLLDEISFPLMIKPWALGLFSLDTDPGPFVLVRCDGGAVKYLRGCPCWIAFGFYRMAAGGLFALFVDVDSDYVRTQLTHPHVLFEVTYGLDEPKLVNRIRDTLSQESLRICFAQGEDHHKYRYLGERGRFRETEGPVAQFDVVAKLTEACRERLLAELASLLDYHQGLSPSVKNFAVTVQQFQVENPQELNPILKRTRWGLIKRLFGGSDPGTSSRSQPLQAPPARQVLPTSAEATRRSEHRPSVSRQDDNPKVVAAESVPMRRPAPSGDNYVDECFLCNWSELDDPRDWGRDPELRNVPDLVYESHYTEALAHLEKAACRYTDYYFLYYWKAIILSRQGSLAEAMDTLREGLSKSRVKFYLCQKRADLMYEAGDLNEAVIWWIRSAVSQSAVGGPKTSQPFIYLAYISGFLGDENAKRMLLAVVDRLTTANRFDYSTQMRIQSLVASQGNNSMRLAIAAFCKEFLS